MSRSKRTPTQQLVDRAYTELVQYHGASWHDLSQAQIQEKLAAKLFFILCQNFRCEAKSGDPLGEYVAGVHAALVERMAVE